MAIKINTFSTNVRYGKAYFSRNGQSIEISPSTRSPAFAGGLELNIVTPFPATVSLTKIGATDHWKNFVLSCATGPQIAYWLVVLGDRQSGRMWFPGFTESPSIDFSLERVESGWRESLYTFDHRSLLARISGTKESWEPLSRWQHAD